MPVLKDINLRSFDPTILLLLPAISLFLFFVVLPLGRMIFVSFFDPEFTLNNYIKIFSSSLYLKVILRTLIVSLVVCVCCLMLGYPVSYLLADLPPKIANILLILVVLPIWSSILVRTFSWIVLIGRNGLFNKMLINLGLISEPLNILFTSKAVIIGMVQILLPIMILPLFATMKGIDRNLLMASKTLGANAFRTFVRIFLPLSFPGIMAGCAFVFIISIGFFVTPAVLGGARDIMIAMLIETNITTLLKWGFATSLSVFLLFIVLSILFLFNKFIGFRRFTASLVSEK